MKRDMDLIRKILFEVEKAPYSGPNRIDLEIEGYSWEDISHHVLLLWEAEFIEGAEASGRGREYKPIRLTWDGHEFLEAVKDDTRWAKVKNAMGKAGGFVYQIAMSVATTLLKEQALSLLE